MTRLAPAHRRAVLRYFFRVFPDASVSADIKAEALRELVIPVLTATFTDDNGRADLVVGRVRAAGAGAVGAGAGAGRRLCLAPGCGAGCGCWRQIMSRTEAKCARLLLQSRIPHLP